MGKIDESFKVVEGEDAVGARRNHLGLRGNRGTPRGSACRSKAEEADLVVVAKRPHRHSRDLGELTDSEHDSSIDDTFRNGRVKIFVQ